MVEFSGSEWFRHVGQSRDEPEIGATRLSGAAIFYWPDRRGAAAHRRLLYKRPILWREAASAL